MKWLTSKQRVSRVVFVLATLAPSLWAQTLTDQYYTARDLFNAFMAYKASKDVRLAELYADNAKIRVRQLYPDGQERINDTSGERWKVLIQNAAAVGKGVPPDEDSTFDPPRIEVQGEFIMVRAPRLSLKRCFRDDSYYQIHGRRSDGSWAIVQELISTIPVSYCNLSAPRKK